ncbi:hypothetical protein MTBUT4_590019 [Magnetospirillum sp. UT-4]|nr:hypothetical protein MTBUT4_590019 [Magnetospirillum sp. UT-4]
MWPAPRRICPPGRKDAQRDVDHRASGLTHREGKFVRPGGLAFQGRPGTLPPLGDASSIAVAPAPAIAPLERQRRPHPN